MTFRTTLLAAAAASSLAGAASADAIRPSQAAPVDLGPLAGVGYYTVAPDGYHVVVTLAPRAAAPAVRFEAVLAPGQRVIVSMPRQAGLAARAVAISREGDTVSVAAVPAGIREAAALP
ncbi:hypothetical protein OPKNFCMD_6134 [Methylobacterium crusticola]|uniref:Uncharacterized protein n=1 Tax=Methylobacterium crusticola TaxID=1697972 RepID=A0ABQ4R991_9HYPH|nr:hypothetical protein [Methylobacterium crusticola]GJD53359.1 hypothetical protein OPKNFCMD_6134 [Methylobacterium crusticola]